MLKSNHEVLISAMNRTEAVHFSADGRAHFEPARFSNIARGQ